MNSYLITARSLELAKEQAIQTAKKEGVGKFDQSFFEYEKDLGIEDIRNIQKTIFLTPFRGEKKAVFLILSKKATTQSQNAMLKLLEEPPKNTLIFLIAPTPNFFLPTILSRVRLIEIKERNEKDDSGFQKIIELSGVGDKLFLAQEITRDKEDALKFLENAIFCAREEMIKNASNPAKSLKLRNVIHQLETAHYDLTNTNVSPRLSMENALFNLP